MGMQTTRIDNRIGVRASSEQIWDVIADLENWHLWNPYENSLQGTLGFGAPLSFTESYPGQNERTAQASVGEWEPCGQLIWFENRGFLFRSTRFFEIEPLESNACILTNGIIFSGLRGEMFHDKHRSKIRPAIQTINEQLKALVESRVG